MNKMVALLGPMTQYFEGVMKITQFDSKQGVLHQEQPEQ